ncbi:acyl-CoA dehydratase activase [Tepidimicrobium xylanilyticum]|uniref:CoA-substrate-specific enzyme activase, putative n=1 Tax=Tepidimicrobium xylanilyticum TaxID=1123352 RepID=A0A1H2TZE0_9FIRM|nr:acyl-CoA dehydratase activase [Tepidimicrobium xylanilyticum]GMG98063.1 2-hydroxyglutaryl-CoA dehydratase [Tepidimicrobium xylanilyticum]SDW49296.1 CoA-substrate-specific enzyme activase, putative [Tepidimicrobium xylanilyticum]
MHKYYMGIDVGSVSTNIVLIDDKDNVYYKRYLRTQGKPIEILKEGIGEIEREFGNIEILGVGVTGSGRYLANIIVGADIVKNEITAHAVAGLTVIPEVRTIIEIGGQDSKIILIRDRIVTDFAMNTVCAAGTGSFLDRQAIRLGIDINDFGKLALQSKNSVRIAGRCAVFAESDMIHKQQLGHNQSDIAKGLCDALVRNYLNNVGKGKEILPPVLFQGGVAANIGIREAFKEALNMEIHVPKHYDVMGAIGASILAKEEVKKKGKTNFKGISLYKIDYQVNGFECDGCSNVCEVVEIKEEGRILARYGDKCGKWSNIIDNRDFKLA